MTTAADPPREAGPTTGDMTRRDVGRAMLAGMLAGPALGVVDRARPAPENGLGVGAGVKLAVQMNHICQDPTQPSDEDLSFVRQLGVRYVTIWLGAERATAEVFKSTVARYRAAGIHIWNIGNSNVHNMEEVTLNLPGRDRKIEQYIQYLRHLNAAGLTYTTYAHMGNGIWSTGRRLVRGAPARVFDQAQAREGRWQGKTFRGPLTHGRRYTAEEIWDNFTYFIRRVAPVAEELGVRIGIHPDDPPVPELGGVPRCMFSSFDGYRRALEIADSDNIGICLCCGCWLEGGPLMGKDVVETIRYFGRRGKIFKVHFRNVDAPLPRFTETFLDNGYMDMYEVMRALVEVGFDGAAIPDHIPRLVGAPHSGIAHCIGYMQALLQRAQLEAGVS